jgi:ubiquinone/menaquinone biosynthesis C-methylase UbiE
MSDDEDRTPDIYDPVYVKGVFDRCSGRYIAFSYFCSMGFTERWRKNCITALGLTKVRACQGYDLMAGTGEAWPHLLRHNPNVEKIVAVDISSGMHLRAMDRLHQMRAHKIEFVEDDVLASKLEPDSADFVISTFGLKTFNEDQHRRLAALVAKTLRSGGRFSFIEASDPKGWWLRPLYLFHLKIVLPMVERLLLRGAQDFSMIGQYSTKFGNASGFAAMLREHGLNAEYRKYFFGCATGAVGYKP